MGKIFDCVAMRRSTPTPLESDMILVIYGPIRIFASIKDPTAKLLKVDHFHVEKLLSLG